MTISALRVTSLRLPLEQPYIWSPAVEEAFHVNLIGTEDEDGSIGEPVICLKVGGGAEPVHPFGDDHWHHHLRRASYRAGDPESR